MKIPSAPPVRPVFRALLIAFAGTVVLSPAFVRADYRAEVLADGPLGYWRLGETDPEQPSSLQVVDNLGFLGADGDGELVNLVLLGQPGALAAGEDKSATIPEYGSIDIPHAEALNVNGPFTVEFWAKPLVTRDLVAPVSSLEVPAAGDDRSGYLFYQRPDGQWEFRLGDDQGYVASPSGGALTPGAWNHVAGVYDGANAILYVDGVEAGRAAVTRPFAPTPSAPFRIGATGAVPPTRYFNGGVDEVAYYPSALTPAQIAEHHATGRSAAPVTPYAELVLQANPAGYWRLNDASPYPAAVNEGTAGAAFNGVISGEVLASEEGAVTGDPNGSLTFDGATGKIDVPWNPGFTNTPAFTAEVWTRIAAGEGRYRSPFASRDDTPVGTTAGFIFYADPNDNWQFWTGTGAAWAVAQGAPVADGEWVHLVGAYEAGIVYFYMNGVLVDSVFSPNYRPNPSRVLRIGSASTEGPGDWYLPGEVDEAAVYNVNLSSARIAAHYRAATGADPEEVPVTILEEPQPVEVITGAPVRLQARVSGSAPLTYQWTKNGTPVEGAAGPVLSIAAAALTDGGQYVLKVTNSAGTVESAAAEVTVNPVTAPVITQQPEGGTVYAGGKFTFTVAAEGALTFTYQWKKDGADIEGATSETYTVPGAEPGTYSVAVTSGAGTTQSDNAVLAVIPPPDAYATLIMASRPSGYWRLDETTSVEVIDYAGAHTGERINEPVFGAPGALSGNAATGFDGFGSKVDVPWSADLNTPVFTVECWAMVDGGDGTHRSPLTSRDDFPQRGYIFYCAPGNTWEFWFGSGTGWTTILPGVTAEPGEWYHLAATYDGTTAAFYINGEPAGTATAALSLNTARPMRFGGGATEGEGNFFMPGAVDEVAYYDTVLTPEVIASRYSAVSGQPATPPTLTVAPGTGNFTLTWTEGALESAMDLSGPWTPVRGAVSPHTENYTAPRKFFRLRY